MTPRSVVGKICYILANWEAGEELIKDRTAVGRQLFLGAAHLYFKSVVPNYIGNSPVLDVNLIDRHAKLEYDSWRE